MRMIAFAIGMLIAIPTHVEGAPPCAAMQHEYEHCLQTQTANRTRYIAQLRAQGLDEYTIRVIERNNPGPAAICSYARKAMWQMGCP
jgi:hypothetical protein